MPRSITYCSLVVILLVGAILRLHSLSSVPAGFFCDEASIGYNAYTLIHTGSDEYHKSLPFFFEAFGEYKSPVAIYYSVLPISVLGLSEFSTRLTAALFGILTLPLIFVFLSRLQVTYKYAPAIPLVGSALLAVSPWHVHLSRVAFELPEYLFFLVLALICAQKAVRSLPYLFLFIVAAAVSFYAYFAARLMVPAFCVPLLIILLKRHTIRTWILATLCAVICSLPFIPALLDGSATARFKDISVFSPQAQIPHPWTHALTNYASHFSVDFLFTKGDIDAPGQFITRHSIRGLGELYRWQAALILVGVIYLVRRRQWGLVALLIYWLSVFPLGSTFTQSTSAQATRSIAGLIPVIVVSGSAAGWLPRKYWYLTPVTLIIMLVISIAQLWPLYYEKYNTYSSDFWGWQYGQREIIQYFLAHQSRYQDLYSVGEANAPDIFFKFYDPHHLCTSKCRLGDPLHESIIDPTRRQLFALNPRNLVASPLASRFTTLYTVYYPDTSPAFVIGTFSSP